MNKDLILDSFIDQNRIPIFQIKNGIVIKVNEYARSSLGVKQEVSEEETKSISKGNTTFHSSLGSSGSVVGEHVNVCFNDYNFLEKITKDFTLKNVCLTVNTNVVICNVSMVNYKIPGTVELLDETDNQIPFTYLIIDFIDNDLKNNFMSNLSYELRGPVNDIITNIEALKITIVTNTETSQSIECSDSQEGNAPLGVTNSMGGSNQHSPDGSDKVTTLRSTKGSQNRDLKRYFSIIDKSISYIVNVIDNILEFTNLDSGIMKLSKRIFNFRDTIDAVYKIIEPKIKENNITLVSIIDDNIPNYLFGDNLRIQEILINLYSNSINAIRENCKVRNINTTVKMVQDPNLGSSKIKLLFSVSDTGIGIKDENKHLLFRSIVQMFNSYENRYFPGSGGGLGLGLAISKEIAKLMNGDIWLERTQTIQMNKQTTQPKSSYFHYMSCNKKESNKEVKNGSEFRFMILLDSIDDSGGIS